MERVGPLGEVSITISRGMENRIDAGHLIADPPRDAAVRGQRSLSR